MAFLSVEEENYVRMSLLLTGISPRAARTCFNLEFAPACLNNSLKKEYNNLLDLKKKRIINQPQWSLLFPKPPDCPDSKTFDVTLMTSLMRNLTSMRAPLRGYDNLPPDTETTNGADFARIKYYRNYLAHLNETKIDTSFFNMAWTNIDGAITRLGGPQMKQECDLLKTKPLDQTSQEIMTDIKRANTEIWELKESFESLKLSNNEIKKSHEILQEDHTHMTTEVEKIKTSQKETVPWNIKDGMKNTLRDWKDDDKMFINTRASQNVLNCIMANNCVTITASSGVGKTATLRHVALQMVEEGYDVLMVTEPGEIVKYNNPNKKTLFVFDDLCGNFSVDQSDIKYWLPVMENVKRILDLKQTKILAACRLQVYNDEKFDSLSIFKSCVCNLLSDHMRLSETEKMAIAEMYLKTKASTINGYCNLYDCFPLLCKLYYDNPNSNLDIIDFFQNPFLIYEAQIEEMLKKGQYTEYCVLALCVMFNNKMKEEIFTEEVNEEIRLIIENTCEACRLPRGTSRLVLKDELESLKETFIKKEYVSLDGYIYRTIHDKIFDFLAYSFGQKMIQCLIKNANAKLIKERFLLESRNDLDQFITIIQPKYHQIYIERMIIDWSKGQVSDVFSNINMKKPQFRQIFMSYVKSLDKSYQKKLALAHAYIYPRKLSFKEKAWDYDDIYVSPLLNCCHLGDVDMVQWCCDYGVDVNISTHNNEQTPILIASEQGYTEIAHMLLERKADINFRKDIRGQLPLMKAIEHGHTEIVLMLLDRGADYNRGDKHGQSSIMKTCKYGDTALVRILKDRGVDWNKCDAYGQSPLWLACEYGNAKIVKLLLEEGVDYHKCDELGQSPLIKACEYGNEEIVKMLLERGADYNKCSEHGQSPVMKACEHGHTEILKMLLTRGADFYKCDWRGNSPIIKACENGLIEIAKLLLEKGVDCNGCDANGQSPVIGACEYGHTELVKMLLDRDVDCNKCDNNDCSPLFKSSEHGHTEIVKMLIDRGLDYDKCDRKGQTPIMKACEHGHRDVVEILLNTGADYNKCVIWERTSPLMKASQHGHTEIVKMLVDKGADYTKLDRWGRSPVMIASANGHNDIVTLINEQSSKKSN